MNLSDIDYTRILSLNEVQTVVLDLKRKAKRTPNGALNLTIFRLSCGAGLRRCEISGINVRDFALDTDMPYLLVKADATKTNRFGRGYARKVPLWWDAGTLDDVRRWKQYRLDNGAAGLDPFVYVMRRGPTRGGRLGEKKIASRWKTSISSLGADRVDHCSVHDGRHSFCSHALAAGRSLVEVSRAAGHRSLQTTEIYLHNVPRVGVPDLFPMEVVA